MSFIFVGKRTKPLRSDLPPILTKSSIWHDRSVVIPKKLNSRSRYFAIEVLRPDEIDNSEFHALPSDSLAIVGILASSFFPIWVRAISERTITVSEESATAYNSFPFPDLSNKDVKILEEKCDNIFQARSFLSYNKLSDIYGMEEIPEHLLMAHEDLDEELLKIYGLPADSTNEQILDKLAEKYASLIK